jgi:hypothetical protein
MSKRAALALIGAAVAILAFVPSAQAAFIITDFDVTYTKPDGSPAAQAGSHPAAMATSLQFSIKEGPKGEFLGDGSPKDLTFNLPAGFIGDRAAVPYCTNAEFLTKEFVKGNEFPIPTCANTTAVGTLEVVAPGEELKGVKTNLVGAYNLVPPPGAAAKIGFLFLNVPIALLIRVNPQAPHNLVVTLQNTSDIEPVGASRLTVWGNPAASEHDGERARCAGNKEPVSCPIGIPVKPFLTLPRSCAGPMSMTYKANSWETPDVFVTGLSEGHDDSVPPNPLGLGGCGKLSFGPGITAKPTSLAANSPSGLDFSLDVKDEGLGNPEGLANSDIRKAVVTLPEGFSVNPSIAEGLEVCTPGQAEGETASSVPGAGCPNASKIGTVEVETPLLDENVNGALYQAAPYDNPFNSLIALYIVLKNPTLGISVVQPVKVESDPVTGRLTTVADELPQLPFSHFKLHFREGTRSPLVTPSGCGAYDGHDPSHEPVEAVLTPWSGTSPIVTTAAFQITTGPEGGPCPTGGLPPFRPGLIAGTLNNAAGRFSPFNVRMFRSDAEQEITRFSIKLPPGISGKLAGIPYCPDAGIAKATARKGPHGGQEELNDPSCPAASEIGHTLAGSGVGPSLAYAPGKLYLAGPYRGSNLSMVSITAATVGPFDLGTVVVRLAFKIDPETAEVFIDSTGSDPIPHIIQGVPVHLRDIRAYTDRPNFVLNPTSCKRTSTASTLLGSGLDFGSEADDRPVTVSTPFQAADCASLPFKPRLSLKLKGGTKRGAHPAFTAVLRMNGIGEAGVAKAQVTLPKSEFIENAHFNTICTRVQFKAGKVPGEQCPAGSIYGHAKATTPILAEPLEGPIFLRSSEHQLPDVVAALHNSQVDIVLDGRVDSVKGRLRSTFESTPDAPVSSAVFNFLGGKKGLFVNSTNLCKGKHKAEASFTGQNGKKHEFKPLMQANCPKGNKRRAPRASR